MTKGLKSKRKSKILTEQRVICTAFNVPFTSKADNYSLNLTVAHSEINAYEA